jgi:hydroxymethylpyrimidine pyrophosphatase-like HAD family hydrolase
MRNNQKKAFFFDFDGTLWFGSYGEKTLKALKILHDKGHLIFYNSGRSKGNTRKERVSLIPFDGMLYGGSHAEIGDKTVFRKDIPRFIIEEVISLEKAHGLLIIYEGVKGVYKSKGILPQYNGEEQDDISILLDTENYPITKFSIIKKQDENGEYLSIPSEVIQKLNEHFFIVDLDHYAECMLKGMGKDFITEKVVKYLGMEKQDVYAFGDSLNDLAMFKACHHRIAIGHSPEELKALAEYVTKEEQNGVYEALVHLGFISESEVL